MTSRPRALIVAYHFPPDPAIGTMRTLRVVQHLAREEWDVTVLAGDPRTYRHGMAADPELMRRVPGGVRVVQVRAIRGFEALKRLTKRVVGRRSSTASAIPPAAPIAGPLASPPALARVGDVLDAALAIPDQESAWLLPAIARGLGASARWRPDVVYSSAPPWTGQLVASVLASILRCPWVADFRDPWGRAPWRGDRFAFAMNVARRLERFVVRRADRVVFVSQENRDEFASHYGSALAAKFRVVPNGCDLSEFDHLERPQVTSDPFVLLHAGSLYASRTPVPLLKAIAAAIRRGTVDPQRFRLRFMGAMALAGGEVAAVCSELGLSGVVEFAARVPRAQSLAAMTRASALLLLQPGHPVAVPAKLYEYLAAGRPILAIAEGEAASIVRASGAGVAAPSDDEEAVVAALERVIQMGGEPVRRPSTDVFDGAKRAAEICAVLSEMVGGRVSRVSDAGPETVMLRETKPTAPLDPRS